MRAKFAQLSLFKTVWLVDFEFNIMKGENSQPICLVGVEVFSGRKIRIFREELLALKEPPYDIGPDSLFIAYYSSAEFGCHLSLGWLLPIHVIDFFAEFRNITNGKLLPSGNGLIGALIYFGLDAISVNEKKEMRELALRCGEYSAQEKIALLDYCESDVIALGRLLPYILRELDLPRALLRGRYFKAAARIEFIGIPADLDAFKKLNENWSKIQERLVVEIDKEYDVYDGLTFKIEKFKKYLIENNISWPHLPTGNLDLCKDTFRKMVKLNPKLSSLYELRLSMAEMRLNDFAIGPSARNRYLMSAFSAKTGRNQPSSSQSLFGPSTWVRSLIKPLEGYAIAYIDWCQQEFGIAAALSKDEVMMEAYRSGDPYLAFAKQAGAVPEAATKHSHSETRDLFKQCALAVQYAMGEVGLAETIGKTTAEARALLKLHRDTYSKFWQWSDSALDHAYLKGWLQTVFGWKIHLGNEVNPRSVRNFPMQANGSEMLRLAACLTTEAGIEVCAPVHDALLIQAPIGQIDQTVLNTQDQMAEASMTILSGFCLRTDVQIVKYPDRYVDKRGKNMWDKVWGIINEKKISVLFEKIIVAAM